MSDRHQLATWAGIIAPALFVGVFTLEGWLRPGYDSLREFATRAICPSGFIEFLSKRKCLRPD